MSSFNPRNSQVFSQYPWFDPTFQLFDEFLVAPKSTNEIHVPIDKLMESISKESNFNRQKRGERFIMQKLGLLEAGDNPVPPSALLEYGYSVYFMKYRIADVASWIMKDSPPVPLQTIERKPLPFFGDISKFKELYSWPILVEKAYVFTSVSTHDVSIRQDECASASLKHLMLYLRRTKLQDQESVYLNFDAAAMYLGHLLEGNSDLTNSNAPDLLRQQLSMDPPVDIGRIKNPLHMALTISPIILLVPANYTRNSCGRPRMLELWQALGAERPEWVRIAEKELWMALFDLSLSPTLDTRKRLHEALGKILMQKPESLTELDVFFFHENIPKVKEIAPQHGLSAPATPNNSNVSALREEEEEDEDEDREEEEGGPSSVSPLPASGVCANSPRTNQQPSSNLMQGNSMGERNEMDIDVDGIRGAGQEPEVRDGLEDRGGMDGGALGENLGAMAGGNGDGLDGSEDRGCGMNEDALGGIQGRVPDIPGSELSDMDVDEPAVPETFDPDSEDEDEDKSDKELAERAAYKRRRNSITQNARVRSTQKNTRPSKGKQRLIKSQKKEPKQIEESKGVKRYIEIIDLTLDEAPLFTRNLKDVTTDLKVTATCPSRLYGVMGIEDFIDYTPSFHHDAHLKWCESIISAANRSSFGGYPLHLSKPEQSIIRVLKYEEYVSFPAKEIQDILREKHIVVTGYPTPPAQFDEAAMAVLASPNKPITIQDRSVSLEDSGDECHVVGVTGDLLRSHRSPNGRIFNALDFPMPTRGLRPLESIATDVLAFTSTLDEPYCKRYVEFPSSSMYWGLAATSNSFHYFHVDSDGFGTFVAPQTGAKYWVLAKPKPGATFSSTHLYINSNYAIDSPNTDLWEIEGILLRPGSCLFMRPNTPHLVITPEASICHGGHFYSSATLRQTCHGVLHTFVASSLLTNTEHTSASRELLRRLLVYFLGAFEGDYLIHGEQGPSMSPTYGGSIPNVFTFEGLIDVLSLCNLMELGNVVHPKTYTPNGLTAQERIAMVHGRLCARKVVRWLENTVEIADTGDVSSLKSLQHDVVYPYLASQAAALRQYKKRAPSADAEGVVEFTLESLDAQIMGAFSNNPVILAHYNPNVDPGTYDWAGGKYDVLPTSGPLTSDDDEISGETQGDIDWQLQKAGNRSTTHGVPGSSRKRRHS